MSLGSWTDVMTDRDGVAGYNIRAHDKPTEDNN